MLRRPGPPPPVGVSRVGTALSWFPDGLCGKGTRGAQTPQQGLVGVRRPLAVSCLSVPGLVSVIRGPCSPSCPPVSPGWVGVGAGDLSLAACLPSETLGVGADAAVSYGPPTPMLLLCLGSGCGPPPPTWPSLGGPHTFPRASSLGWLQAGQPSSEVSPGYGRLVENPNVSRVTRVAERCLGLFF